MAPASQSEAPVVSPCTRPRAWMITPAARNATPLVIGDRLDHAHRVGAYVVAVEPADQQRHQQREQAGADSHEHVRPQPGGLILALPLIADCAGEQSRDDQPSGLLGGAAERLWIEKLLHGKLTDSDL